MQQLDWSWTYLIHSHYSAKPNRNQTLHPSPVQPALHLTIGLLLPHYELNTQQNHNSCRGSKMVEWATQLHQDSRKSIHLPLQTKNTPLMTIPWIKKIKIKCSTLVALIWHLHVALCSFSFLKKIVLLFWVCTLLVECTYCKLLWIKGSAKWNVM